MVSHGIHCVEIELVVGEAAVGEALLGRVSLLHERRIGPLLDRVCSELSGPERLDRIDSLELELGSIVLGEFDDAFIRKLEAALRSRLAQLLSAPRAADAFERASLELLEAYARTGNLPWWADRRDGDPVAAQLRLVLARAPRSWLALLRSLVDDSLALTRLARHCDDALVELLAKQGQAAPALLSDLRELEQALARVGDSAGGSTRRVRAALLAALGRGAKGEGVGRTLVSELVARWPGVLASLGRAELPTSLSPGLHAAIERAGPSTDARPDDAASERKLEAAHDTQRDAELARGEAGEVERARPAQELAGRAEAGEAEHPRRAQELAGRAEAGEANERLASRARSELLASLSPGLRAAFELPEPSVDEHPDDAAGERELEAARRSLRDAELAREQADEAERARPAQELALALTSSDAPPLQGSQAHARARLPEPQPAPRASHRAAPEAPAQVIAARRRALEQFETLDVEDAGLVILWPFLERFFGHVGLLDLNRRFLDEEARMQGIALLSQLAFEDADPLEYRLPLAKLLCGCGPAAGFVLERPLAPAQIDECEGLLAAVIDNAPILRDTSVASFRASFIQRPALLSVRAGAWLIEVEPRPYDLVLERLAWSWGWVKLPWMTEALTVRW